MGYLLVAPKLQERAHQCRQGMLVERYLARGRGLRLYEDHAGHGRGDGLPRRTVGGRRVEQRIPCPVDNLSRLQLAEQLLSIACGHVGGILEQPPPEMAFKGLLPGLLPSSRFQLSVPPALIEDQVLTLRVAPLFSARPALLGTSE